MTSPLARLLAPIALCLTAVFASIPALADNFVVNDGGYSNDVAPGNGTCADAGGKCTLNAAIQEGNFRSGSHTITFAPGVTMVTLQGNLAQLRAPFTITGDLLNRTILNGFNGINHFGCFDLTDSGDIPTGHDQTGANGSTIANMIINGCNGHGISANGHGWTFINNYIGTNPTGTAAVANTGHGISVSSSRVYSQETSQFLINLAAQIPAQPLSSADASNFAAQLTTVLATAQLGPVLITGNVISGNAQNGVEIFSENIAGVFVTANMIGTDVTGNLAIGNGANGVHFVGSPFANMIIGNVISGNVGNGIQDDAGKVALPNFIMANRIGLTAVNPALSAGNGLSGITVDSAPEDAIPHFNPTMISLIIGPGNVVSGNNGANNNAFPDVLGNDQGGIVVTGSSKGVKILNNTVGIGEFPPGTPLAVKSYGNAGDGIVVTVSDVTIDGNVVSANARHGVLIKGSTTTGTKLTNNFIGVHPSLAGDLTIGNGVDGVHIDAASTSVIGGSGGADPNVIAGNGRNGVKIRNGNANNGWANLLQRNRIYSNSKNALTPGVGIDLDFLENASNPLHGEFLGLSYANFDQAQPVICTGAVGEPAACSGFQPASSNGSSTTLNWTIATHGPATFRMEFFSINAASVNAATTMTFLGEQTVTTDITGTPTGAGCTAGRCSANLAAGSVGSRVVMTANDATAITNVPGGGWLQFGKCIVFSNCFVNNTSEFSNVTLVVAVAPTGTTGVASGITTNGATLNGTVTANGASTTVTFEYGTTASYGSSIAATQSPLAANASGAAVSAPVSGLACGTLYHFRVVANNGTTTNGGDQTFTTSPCPAPTVTTLAATSITMTGATLNGTVSANGAATTVTFEYGLTASYGLSAAATQSPLASNASSAAVSAPIAGLSCGNTYHFRVTANNGTLTNGGDLTFNTAACPIGAPSATTNAATGITAAGATLNGTVSSNGAATTVTFEYGLTAAYGSSIAATQSPLALNASGAAVSAPIAGLACGTTYHFRVVANNGTTTNGLDQSFVTSACPAPTATTGAASAITTAGATLNGTVSSNGAVTAVTFDYGLTVAYGTSVAATQSPLAANAGGASVSVPVAGLACGTTYHFRVVANNGAVTNGSDQQFTTSACPPGAPTATTGAASAITTSGATLNGTVTSNGAVTTVTFEYGPTTSYGTSVAAAQSPLAANASGAAVSAAISGLACNTTYHFRVNAANGSTVNGADQQFTTSACPPGAPTATTGAATSITTLSALLNGTVSSNGAVTTVTFEYGTSIAYGSTVAATQSPLPANAAGAAVSATVLGLTCNTLYHFRVTAANGSSVSGADQTFTTSACPPAAPTATTGAASGISTTAATLNGTVSSNGAATTVTFEYGTTVAYGTSVPATQSPLAANAVGAVVSAAISGLTCNTLYHFRVVAANGQTTNGADQTFTTAACPPGAPSGTTGAASGVTPTGATLNGTVSSNGAATTVTFEYGTTVAYGTSVPATQSPLAANAVGAAVSAAISGLTCNTLYHFRVVAANGQTTNGADQTFTTAACPPGAPSGTTGAASGVTPTGATLNGTVSSNGAITSVTFEYGLTTAYGSSIVASQGPLPDNASGAAVSATITGLTCNTTYHFRVVAVNGQSANGADRTFTTSACQTSFSGVTVAPGVTGTVTLSGGGPTCSFSNAAFVSVVAPPPPGVTFPFGLFDFTAVSCTPGSTVTIQIVYSQALPPGTQYYKYGPTPGNPVDHWYVLPSAVVNGNTVTFTITDGQIGDDDLTANGTIVDQGGPGVPPGEGGGAQQIPTLNETALALLSLLIAAWGWLGMGRRSRA